MSHQEVVQTNETLDPVCGMKVDPQKAAGESDYSWQRYYFCSVGCKRVFDAEPQKYVQPEDHVGHDHAHGHE